MKEIGILGKKYAYTNVTIFEPVEDCGNKNQKEIAGIGNHANNNNVETQ